MSARAHVACWRRLDSPGHEVVRLERQGDGWRLAGVVALHSGGEACALSYTAELDASWHTRTASVEGWIGARVVALRLESDGAGRWWRDGHECPAVAGCLDVDFGFSPATNLLPIRRLAPAVGDAVDARAAWLRFPELTVEPLAQRYRRVGERSYAYESAGGAFRADLEVDGHGMVVRYGDLWITEAG